jgi:MFS family permease
LTDDDAIVSFRTLMPVMPADQSSASMRVRERTESRHGSLNVEASYAHTRCHEYRSTPPVQGDRTGPGTERFAARRGWGAFGAAGFAVFALLLGSNLPNSLFPLYAKVYGRSPVGVTLLFATYTLLVIPAVLAFGPLSDVEGRRELLIAAIVVAALAAGLFAVADAVVVLFLAQAVQAMALGALQGTAAPTLVEHDPTEHARRASMVASAMTISGAAVGPVIAGLLAQYAALPLRLCYLVEIGVLAVALVAAALTTELRRRARIGAAVISQ